MYNHALNRNNIVIVGIRGKHERESKLHTQDLEAQITSYAHELWITQFKR